jgi:hypothetical protein
VLVALVVVFVDGPLVVVVDGPLVVVVGGLVVVVVGGLVVVVVDGLVVPGGVSDESGAVYRYSLAAALGGVRYAIQSLMVPQKMSRSPSNSAPSLVATIPDTHELPSPL